MSKFFGRSYTLLLTHPSGGVREFNTKDGIGMDIKFDVSYARGQTAREGTISILGLGNNAINAYTELAAMTRGKAMSELMRVRLDAGYVSSAGGVCILDGYAWYASVTTPPEKWLTLRVSEYNPLGSRGVTLGTRQGGSIRSFLTPILEAYEEVEGVHFEIFDKTEDGLADVAKEIKMTFKDACGLGDAIKKINQELSDQVWVLLNTHEGTNGARGIAILDKAEDKVTKANPVLVNGKNGLLSVSGIDAVNGSITTFLDGTVSDELTHMKLESELNPQANGTYYICRKQFVGHYLGTEWYTRYFCTARKED